jgi:glycosyltransferase involved in cell wall biosynthesis
MYLFSIGQSLRLKTSMELLLVSHKYPPATGGMEKQSFELIKGLSLVTKVHVIVYDGKESRLWFFMKLQQRIKNMLRLHPQISIIHYNDGLIAAASLHHRGYKHLKRTVTFHGLDVVFPSFVFQKMIIPKFNDFDLVFAVSNATAAACVSRGIAADKVVVVKNGVDVSLPLLGDRDLVAAKLSKQHGIDFSGKKLLVAVGRPVKRKGFSWFIEEVMLLLEVDVVLLLIGPVQSNGSFATNLIQKLPSGLRHKVELFLGLPSDESALRRLVRENNYKGRVIRTGRLPLTEMNELIGVADAFIMPNIEVAGDMEGFGLVCLEACMQGAKVIAAASGGITDAITDQQNGVLLPSGLEKCWAKELNGLLSGQKKWPLIDDQAINFTIANFSWEKMSEAYFQHFSKI